MEEENIREEEGLPRDKFLAHLQRVQYIC